MNDSRQLIARPATTRASRWSRTDVNFALDTLLLLLFLALLAVSAIVRFVFPPATVAAGYSLWGGSYDAWAGVQFGVLAIFALAVVVHLMLHWTWVCNLVAIRCGRSKREAKRKLDEGIMTLYGVGLLIACVGVIGLVVAAAAMSLVG